MAGEVGPPGQAAQLPATIRRAALEAQLSLAIRRAQKSYLKVKNTPQSKPSSSPPHLGRRIDIRV